MASRLDNASLSERTLAGETLAGARLIRLLEERDPDGIEALKKIYPASGNAYLVGVTGPPGAGKSTLVSALVAELRKREKTVGVIAVDPTSPYSGGAILGDRVRMQQHATDEGVFIRSMATRGQLGGLSRSTFEATLVLDAMGFDVVVVETVGVGQDELDIAKLAHTTLVVSIPGMGDGVQALKAGILEIADVHVVNKADLPGADDVERMLHVMLETGAYAEGAWKPRLVRTAAEHDDGIGKMLDAMLEHREHLVATQSLALANEQRDQSVFLDLVREGAGALAVREVEQSALGIATTDALRKRKIDPFSAAETLLATLRFEA
ncbi:MAG: LAO/AO transport system kinase [Myxococcota bacterium]|jgi:LAO/AO transport system kinase